MDTTLNVRSFPPFKDIRKPTIKETYECLASLAKDEARRNLQNLETMISSNSPLPLFDESLRLMTIDILQIKNEVVKILLSQNDCQIKRILSCKWFFFNLSSNYCEKELFPVISISLRCKIIKQLSKYLKCTKEAEKHFLLIKKKYGTGRAEYLLPRCSPEFILNYFEKIKPTFDSHSGKRSLMKICQRYPEAGFQIISDIFEMKKNSCKAFSYEYRNALLYLGGHYPDKMVVFLKKHHSYMPSEFFGKKLSKKLGLRLKDSFIPDFLKGEIIMKENSVFLIFPLEDQAEFLATLVRRHSEVLSFGLWKKTEQKLCKFLNSVSPKDRLGMVQLVFQKVFNKNFDDHSICWTYELLKLLPTQSRQPYLRKLEAFFDAETSEFEKNVDDSFSFSVQYREEFFKLFDCNSSFEKFHELLKKSPPVTSRQRILSAMVENCKINNDVKGLEKMVEFVATRHRNDEPPVICGFVHAICDSFRAQNLNLKIYETIEELIYFLKVKGIHHDYLFFMWMEKHIYYRLEHGLNVEHLVNSLFESAILQSSFSYVRDFKSKHTKTLILALWEKARIWILENSSDELRKKENSLIMNIVAAFRKYNIQRTENLSFRDAPGLQELLKKKLADHFHDVGGEDWSLEIWDRYYEKVLFPGDKLKFLNFTCRKNPKLIADHLNNVLNILFSDYCKRFGFFFVVFLKVISFYGQTEKAIEIILNEFKNGESVKRRKTALNLYSQLCTIEEFSETVKDYIPTQKKVERWNSGFDEIQMAVPSFIKNVKPRWKNFDLIMKFMFGDFLKSARLSFCCCCWYTRRDFVLPLLKKYLKIGPSSISYQKDIIKLIVEISDQEEKSQFLIKFWEKFEDPARRGFLLKAASKVFLEQPSKETFEILEKFILDCDTTVIYSKPLSCMIPKEFYSDFNSALWRFSEKTKPLFKKDFRQLIIWNFKFDDVRLLKSAFCESIIRENLFHPSSNLDVNHFAIDYLHADPLSTMERLGFVLNLLNEQKPPPTIFNGFLEALMLNVLGNAVLFDMILRRWPEYPDGVLFEKRELLSLHSLYHKFTDVTPEELANELTKMFLNIDSLNDLLVIYTGVFSQFLKNIGTFKAVRTVKELVLNAPNKTIAILAICSIPGEAFKWYEAENLPSGEKSEIKETLNEITKILNDRRDKYLGIYRWWKLGNVNP